jgi:hypothetical protein
MDSFDFWYAVNNTEVLVRPQRRLETFGATVVDYRLVAEVMDRADQVRVREGRLHAERPEIVTPSSFAETALEGFRGDAPARYLQWLREHEKDLLILRYGFRLRNNASREELVTDRMDAVIERVRADMNHHGNPLAALVRGVDEPWEVCLVKLAVDLVQHSAGHHARVLREDPTGDRHEIEQAFSRAARDRACLDGLADLLRRRGLFGEYEDRFFALVRHHQGRTAV